MNIKTFKKELDDIGCENPIIIAFGNEVHNILVRKYKGNNMHKLTHYSCRISKEDFKKEVDALIENIGK